MRPHSGATRPYRRPRPPASPQWEFELAAGFDDTLPVGRTLNQTILVPFPLESCLSGAFRWPTYSTHMFYRLLFDAPAGASTLRTLLHFGAVDYNATAYLNGAQLGAPHLGGYDDFSFDLGVAGEPGALLARGNELILRVYDPSDTGVQVHGKQRISAISNPSGDTYTPSSGVWQTAWLETVPAGVHVSALRLRGSTTHLFATVSVGGAGTPPALVNGTITFNGAFVASFAGAASEELVVPIPAPQQLWHPTSPNLYDLAISVLEPSTGTVDTVTSYFGMREVALLPYTIPGAGGAGSRIGINGNFTFLAGWLDQSWFPDGEYTAPGDDALRFDVQGVLDFGMNFVRLHQKVNPVSALDQTQTRP